MHVRVVDGRGRSIVMNAKWMGWHGPGLLPSELAYVRVECGCEIKLGRLWRCVGHTGIASVTVL